MKPISPAMRCLSLLALALALAAPVAEAADAAANAKPAKPTKTAKAARTTKPAPARRPAKKTAEPAALSAAQLAMAEQVQTGDVECDGGTRLRLHPVDGKPGHFQMQHGKHRYALLPEATTTGAVRLEDKKARMVWIQIPAKSMLMNARIGQRAADNCRVSGAAAAQ